MLYVYDTVVQPYQKDLMRYGVKYKLERISRFGDQRLYYFKYIDRESIVVVPHFMELYQAAAQKVAQAKKFKTFADAQRYVKANLNRTLETDEMPDDESESGITMVMTLDYKAIGITLEYKNNTLSITPEFEIRKENIFGNNIVVSTDLNVGEAI